MSKIRNLIDMNLIAFTGKKYAGKSTAAREITKLVEYPATLSFASPIKRAALAMGFTNEEVYSNDKEDLIAPFNVSIRRVFQSLGTDWGRNMIHPDIWLRMFERQYLLQKKSGTQLVVVDDVRFDNEADMIISLGGTIIEVFGSPSAADHHVSEAGINPNFVHYKLNHNPDLQQFLLDARNLGYLILGATATK